MMSRQSGKRSAGLLPAAKVEKKKRLGAVSLSRQTDMSNGHQFRRSTRRNMSSVGGKAMFTVSSDTLSGVVALVELGPESRAKTLRATLAALGASIAPSWNPLVTHVVWSEGGCRDVRARARSLAAKVVSPLWVEACAVAREYLPEKSFPAAPRRSDLPSPTKMQQALKRVELDSIQLNSLLDSSAVKKSKPSRFRVSRSSEHKTPDTSGSTSASIYSIKTRSMTKIAAKNGVESAASTPTPTKTPRESIDVESRVNTAPRRALPLSMTPEPLPKPAKKPPQAKQQQATQPEKPPEPPKPELMPPPPPKQKKSKRRLFTQVVPSGSQEAGPSSDPPKRPIRAVRANSTRVEPPTRLTQRERTGLQKAERLARWYTESVITPRPIYKEIYARDTVYHIVLSGMAVTERRLIRRACRKLGAKLQDIVDKKTTHVLIGSLCRVLTVDPTLNEMYIKGTEDKIISFENGHLRTLKAMLGAARGCRILYATWAYESFKASKWLHHFGYEVPCFKNISQKAHIERHAFGLMNSEYAFDIFNSCRVCLSPTTEKRECVEQLLTLCGAVVFDELGSVLHNKHLLANKMACAIPTVVNRTDNETSLFDYDVVIGTRPGEVNSKWVFNSVAAARMRCTRKYTNPTKRSRASGPASAPNSDVPASAPNPGVPVPASAANPDVRVPANAPNPGVPVPAIAANPDVPVPASASNPDVPANAPNLEVLVPASAPNPGVPVPASAPISSQNE